MIKYIKTVRTIYCVNNEDMSLIECKLKEDGHYHGIYNSEVITKTANYLEDLINRYIIVNKRGNRSVLTRIKFEKLNRKKLIKDISEGKKSVYGAIWTYGSLQKEPILKSVIYMNEKGEWEFNHE